MESLFSHPIPDGRLLCTCCPRRCLLGPGEVGSCGALRSSDGRLGRAKNGVTFAIHVAAVEACGFTRFFPGTAFLVVESPGSGLEIAQREFGQTPDNTPWIDPDEAVFLARSWGCKGVVLKTDDPVFGVSEGYELLEKARRIGLGTAVTTTGFLLAKGRDLLFAHADAVNLRLFSASSAFYRRHFGARQLPIQETVEWLSHKKSLWLEVTIPILTGENDRPADIERLARWIREALGPSTPVHVVAGGPQHPGALERAAEITRAAGLLDVTSGENEIGVPDRAVGSAASSSGPEPDPRASLGSMPLNV